MPRDITEMRILIVEDQSDARHMLRNMLGEIGITQVFDAPDGRKAMQFMDTAFDFIDMVIADWNMPNVNGVELLRQLRSVDPRFPFLMVTGRADRDSVLEALNSGVTAYIAKPYSTRQLEAKIRIIAHKIID